MDRSVSPTQGRKPVDEVAAVRATLVAWATDPRPWCLGDAKLSFSPCVRSIFVERRLVLLLFEPPPFSFWFPMWISFAVCLLLGHSFLGSSPLVVQLPEVGRSRSLPPLAGTT